MKRILKFFRVNYVSILIGLFLSCVLIFGYIVLHNIATTERGYEAIGGEIFIFLLPFLWWAMPSLKEKKE